MRSVLARTSGLLALLAFGGVAAAQSTWYVDVNGTPPGDGSMGNPYTSLQDCFAQGSTLDGDTVLVAPGTYVEDLDLLGKSLDVRGTAGAAMTTLKPATATSALLVVGVASARLEGFTLRDGSGRLVGPHTRGGGVLCVASTLELDACELRASQASLGGNLCAMDGSSVTLTDCVLDDGRAWQGAGAYVEGSTLVAQATTFADNGEFPTAPSTGLERRGLGLHSTAGAALELYGCEIDSNGRQSSTFRGAGLYHEGPGTALLDGCTVSSNGLASFSNSWGGGIYAAGAVTLMSTTVSDNRALHEGGGVRGVNATQVQLHDCDVTGNQAQNGGGVYAATLVDCRLVGNLNVGGGETCSGPGGGAHSSSLLRCRLEANVSRERGGGAYNSTLVECELIGNRVQTGGPCSGTKGGGGVWGGSATDSLFQGNLVERTNGSATQGLAGGAAGGAILVGCVLEGNSVESTALSSYYALGGGAYDCALEDCQLVGNRCFAPVGSTAPAGGGTHGGSATGCTFVGNSAESLSGTPLAAGGGAAEATLERCVLVGNTADHGGAAWKCDLSRCSTWANVATQAGGGLSLHPATGSSWGSSSARETILFGNQPDEFEVGAGTLTAQYCDVAGGWPGVGNIAADPDYWNGGAADLHLRPGSPCIGAGDPTLPPDPDGSAREIGALVFDAGYVGGPYVYCEAKTTSQGCLPSIGSSGEPTLTGPDDFFVEASQVTAMQNGILFWGSAPAEVPFLGGTRCVATPIVRTPPSSSGGSGAPCSGAFSFHFSQGYMLGAGLAAGDRVFAQFWFRDPAQPDGTGVGLSDALDFTLLP